ncbi:zinc finger protein 501-like [Drosophila innubila]|uniref:zinc finger protein 501-like n=1 Tax=Drosophila innubila TaxID=198719 RepID=UPI00148C8D54|nr:zinc finger protein 501-like [Drosophila innubila]
MAYAISIFSKFLQYFLLPKILYFIASFLRLTIKNKINIQNVNKREIIENNLVYSMENVCRVCISSAGTLVNIFGQRELTDERELCLAEILNEFVDCNVRSDDSLPQQICLSCVLDAKNAIHFKRRCEQSHQHFCALLREKDNFGGNWQDLKTLCKMEVEEIKVEEFVIEDSYPEPAKDDFDIGSKSSVNLETQHRCDICDEIFPNKTNLMVHALIHTNDDNPDKCPHCGKVFTTRGSLTRHIRVHSGERPYKCVYCEKSFTQSCNLDKHVRIHSGERPYKCSHCQKAFTQSSHLMNHMRIHSHKCTHCSINFSDESLLEEHLRTHFNEMPCKLSQHQKTIFSQTDQIKESKVHSLDRLYKCANCPKSFPSRGDLERHSRVHSGERPFKCSYCSRSFSQSDNLERHMRLHSGERPYKCLYCHKEFIQSTHLVNHLRIHSGERPFQCNRCPKTFTRRENLKKHNHSHSPVNNSQIMDGTMRGFSKSTIDCG